MNILIIGSGGREHAIAWKISQSPHCSQLYIAPGNAGTSTCGINLPVAVTNFEGIAGICADKNIDLVVVGPEEPLVKGLYEFMKSNPATSHIQFIGPDAQGAMLEGSKAFAKDFMQKNHIPTAAYKEFTAKEMEEGIEYLRQHTLPIVLKADGLAAGKGVIICQNHNEAYSEFEQMLNGKFGKAGNKVVVEEYLNGIEMSVFILTDGKNYVLLPEAKDYKRIGMGDTGLNTGGMGAVSPVPFFDEKLKEKVITKVVEPTIRGIAEAGMDYKGFVFIGLMVNDGEPYVIEYNCRMGDPETEVVMPRLKSDLVPLLSAAANGRLDEAVVEMDKRTAVGVVAVSGGYPGDYAKGMAIEGLAHPLKEGQLLFHAGTMEKDGEIVSNGGRVLVATSFGDTVKTAAQKSFEVYKNVVFADMYYRDDIGYEF